MQEDVDDCYDDFYDDCYDCFTYPSPTTAHPHNVLFDGAGNKIPKTATLL